MNKLVSTARQGRPSRRHLALATVLTVAASLLVAGVSGVAQADPEPATTPAAPSTTTFPRSEDPDAPLRAAIAEAKKQNKAVAVQAAYTETSRTWAHPDGHLSTQSYSGPAQLRQADGSWAWIDTTLEEKDGVLKPRLAKGGVEISAGGTGPFASMQLGREGTFGLSWPTALPRPQIKGNVATYVGAAGPSADLVVTALSTGFRHDVVLRERPSGPVEYRIPVHTPGLKLKTTKSGGLTLTGAKGREVASAPAPYMWDTTATEGDAKQPVRQAKVAAEVKTEGDSTVLVLKPDQKWLADPATQYPVTVDPTTTLGVTKEVGIQSPSGQSSAGYLSRFNTPSSGDRISRALMAFDTAPIAGRQVIKATMQQTLRADVSNCSEFQGISALRVTSAWVANNTYWSNQPGTTTEGRSSIDPCSLPGTTGSVWSWDLTAMTRLWATGTANHGLMLRLAQESPIPQYYSESFRFWAQSSGQNVPKLSVDWVLPPEIPTVTAESIDSISGNDAIARSTNVKVTYKSSVPETANLDYTVTVNESTMAAPTAQLPTGEAAYWKLDETTGATLTDSSGKNLPATLTGSYIRGPGQLGQAVTFAGSGSAATTTPVLNTNQSFTVTSWVRLDKSAEPQTVFSQMGVNQPGFALNYETSTAPEYDQRWWFTMITQDRADRIYEVPVQSKDLAKIGQWTHVAVQYDQSASKIRLYVDGVLSSERAHTVDWNARGAFEIGRGRVIAGNLNGAVDDVRAYQRVLTADEIRALVGVPGTTTHNNIPSGQALEKVFTLDNPASFKFVVKACRTGVTPPSCNESPAYRITSDAPVLPSDTQTGMEDPTLPILSGMVNRPSGGPVLAKFYLYDDKGTPVGAAPLGTVPVSGGQRATLQVPSNTVQPGTTYKWQMVACASASDGTGEVCTPKTAPMSFTTPGTPPEPGSDEGILTLALSKDSFVIKTAKTDPAACDGAPCKVTDDTVMRIGGIEPDKTAAVVGFKLNELPNGSAVSEAVLKLGTAVCPAGTCPADAAVTATPLKSPVTSESKGSELQADADASIGPFTLPLTGPQADIAGTEYQWLLLTSNKDEVITFADPAAAEQPSINLTYVPPGPPSEVINLNASGGDASIVASWGLPASNGSTAILSGYDVEVADGGGTTVKTLEVTDPWASISGLVNDQTYTVKVRAKTSFGTSGWQSATATTKAAPPPPDPSEPCIPFLDGQQPPTVTAASESGAQDYLDRIKAYFQAQDAVLEGRADTIWDAPGVTASAPSTAKLSLLNTPLVEQREAISQGGTTRTGSTVELSDPAIQAMPDGSVHVTVSVKRTWTEQDSAAGASTGAGITATSEAGQVEPSEFTVSVFAFDRCGNITIIEVPVEVNEDDSDLVQTDGEAYITSKLGGTSLSPQSVQSAQADPCSPSVAPWTSLGGPGKATIRPAKGLLFEVLHKAIWRMCKPRDNTAWTVQKIGAVSTLYTSPWFINPSTKDKNGRWILDTKTQKQHRSVMLNSTVDIKSQPCFVVKSASAEYGFSIGGSFSKDGVEYSGSSSVAVTQAGGKDCGSELLAPGSVRKKYGPLYSNVGLRTAMWNSSNAADADCWQTSGSVCSITKYAQKTQGIFHYARKDGDSSNKLTGPPTFWSDYKGW